MSDKNEKILKVNFQQDVFERKLVQQDKYTYLVTVLDVNADIHEFPGIVYLIH